MSRMILAAIDVGTTSISLIVSEITDKGARVLGSCRTVSRGLRKGVVVNIEEAANSIRAAVNEAESATGMKIASAVIGITGRHITGLPSTGLIGLQGREISASDRMRAIESAKTVYMPLDREVLHVIPTGFILDGQGGITDPVGMSGVRLESTVHIITANSPSVQNLARACQQAGIEVLDIVFGPVATAGAVLTSDEIDQGALLIDIGGGTTDIAYFRDGAMVHASVLGIGGLHITNDLAVGLKVSVAEAERIKKAAGFVSVSASSGLETIELLRQDGQPQKVSRQQLAAIIQPRCEELFEMVSEEIGMYHAVDAVACSVVLTGGTALLGGIAGLAASVLSMPVRVGLPNVMPGLKNALRIPAYAAAIGLVAYAARSVEETAPHHDSTSGLLAAAAEKIKNAFGYKDFLELFQKKKKGVSYV
ncbi:MAG: cell division protein FtsA [Nitrospirae bacterium]|nr:cell division protein FtsA [Nitrospirota bacterium]